MDQDESEATRLPRRVLLGSLGVAGTIATAGCNGNDDESSETPTERTNPETEASTETTTQSPSATVEVDTSVVEGDESQRVLVEGHVSATRGVESIRIATADTSTRFQADGESEYPFMAKFNVEGGRTYEIEITVTDTTGGTFTKHVETDHVPIFIDSIETDRTVGAHYYPWYETRNHKYWTYSTVAEPVLGEYASHDKAVIDQHLKWSLEHGIEWWSVSWWGPNSPSNQNLRDRLLTAEQFDRINFSILYETVGRFKQFDFDLSDPTAKNRLKEDFEYLEDTYFGRDNYRRINGRPVVYFYVAGALNGKVDEAFTEATADLNSNPYILAGIPFGDPPSTYPIAPVADAITSYTPYSPRKDIENVFHDIYDQGNKVMHLSSEIENVEFIPVVTPGFNDTGIPDYQREDNPILSASPDRFERVINQVSPHLADAKGVLVTSFNEWYENTQVEPSEEYGTSYLELLADNLATGKTAQFDPTGKRLRFDFNKTIVPAETNPDISDTRPLAFVASELSLWDGARKVISYNIGKPAEEPLFLKGAYSPGSYGDISSRWLGGPSGETVLFCEGELSDVDKAILVGQPMRTDAISADVFVDGTQTDTVEFRERDDVFDEYELSLTS